jgi:hypothetical protein
MEPISLTALYAFVAASGFISIDSYLNVSTVTLESTVAEPLQHEGYDRSVVDALFMSEINKIVSIPSLAAKPRISTTRQKPISIVAAEFIKVEGALRTAQSYAGLSAPWLTASIIVDHADTHVSFRKDPSLSLGGFLSINENLSSRMIITGYSPQGGYFSFSAAQSDRKFDEMIRAGAWEAMRYLDPYYASMARFVRGIESGETADALRTAILADLTASDGIMSQPDRALMQNLAGISYLLSNDQTAALSWFEKVVTTDPDNPVGWLNLAFMDVQVDRFEAALERVDRIILPTYWPMTDNGQLLYSAHIIRGVALGELRRFEEATAAFETAIAYNPDTSSAYFYWARILHKQGRAAEAKAKQRQSEMNASKFINYPEVALLYFWLTGEGENELRRRTRKSERL